MDNAKVQATVFKPADGWGFESAIDLKSLGIVPSHVLNIGLNAKANGASVKDRDIKLIWSAADTKDTSYLAPNVFGRGIFFKVGSPDVPTMNAVQAPTSAPIAAIGST